MPSSDKISSKFLTSQQTTLAAAASAPFNNRKEFCYCSNDHRDQTNISSTATNNNDDNNRHNANNNSGDCCSIQQWHSMMVTAATNVASNLNTKTNQWILQQQQPHQTKRNQFVEQMQSSSSIIEHQNLFHQIITTQNNQDNNTRNLNQFKIHSEAPLMKQIEKDSARRHNCDICNKQFGSKSALAKHRLIHSKDRKYVCKECNKSFKRQDHLNGHHLTHLMHKPFFCKVPGCYKSYCDSRSLKRHIESQHQQILAEVVCGNASLRSYLPVIDSIFVNAAGSVHKVSLLNTSDTDRKLAISSLVKMMDGAGHSAKTVFTFEEPKPVQCSVCKKRFKNMAALYGHMRLHGGYSRKSGQNDDEGEITDITRSSSSLIQQQESLIVNRLLNLSVDAITTAEQPIVFTFAPESIRTQTGSCKISQLRSPTWINATSADSRVPPYTPPPILATRRKAAGLFCNISKKPAIADCSIDKTTDLPPLTDVYPHINIGEAYQASIDDFVEQSPSSNDDVILWDCDLLEQCNLSEQTIDQYIDFARSSLVAGPFHIELALYLLYAFKGDLYRAVLAMVEGGVKMARELEPIANYRFPENCVWSEHEIQTFAGLLTLHDKDFATIAQKMITKTSNECVEFYYLFKQVNRERRRKKTPKNSDSITRKYKPS